MFKAIITFSNSEKITISNGQLISPISLYTDRGETFSAIGEPFEIQHHHHAGLIPSITELLMKYDFFEIEANCKAYKSSSVVSVENL